MSDSTDRILDQAEIDSLLGLGSTPAADEADLQPDERDQLRSAITDLPDDQRRALVLAAYMGRTAREISDLDEVPLGTVKTRIRTAMIKLRDELEVGE